MRSDQYQLNEQHKVEKENHYANRNERFKSNYQKVLRRLRAHDVEAMTALCADDAKGRYAPYGASTSSRCGVGLNAFWKGFTQAVPDFHVEVSKCFKQKVTAIVVQAVLGGTISADAPAVSRRKATTYASRTLISSATTRTAKSPTSIVIGQHIHQ